MTVVDELRDLVIEDLGLDPGTKITPEDAFVEDLGADSLDLVELIMSLEERFNIEIPDEDAEKLVTVKDVLNYLREKGVKID